MARLLRGPNWMLPGHSSHTPFFSTTYWHVNIAFAGLMLRAGIRISPSPEICHRIGGPWLYDQRNSLLKQFVFMSKPTFKYVCDDSDLIPRGSYRELAVTAPFAFGPLSTIG